MVSKKSSSLIIVSLLCLSIHFSSGAEKPGERQNYDPESWYTTVIKNGKTVMGIPVVAYVLIPVLKPIAIELYNRWVRGTLIPNENMTTQIELKKQAIKESRAQEEANKIVLRAAKQQEIEQLQEQMNKTESEVDKMELSRRIMIVKMELKTLY